MAGRGDRRLRGRAAAAVVLAGSLLLSGCGLVSGPQPLSEDAPLIMQVTSPVVSVKHILPADYTCYGSGESPPVSWSGAPPKTRSFALVVDDSDAPISPFVYWLVVNIGQLTTEIQGNRAPPGAEVADNSTGHARYDPPCPVGATHSYRITVYALNVRYLPQPQAGPQLLPTWTSIAPHVLARGEMTVTACPAQGSAGWSHVCETSKPGSAT
jgi:Raf kinase inhibitor-like YbhB/YbcL family protein